VQSIVVSLSKSDAPLLLTELPDVHYVVLVLQDGGLVVVHVQVVRRAEDGHDTGEARGPRLPVHAVSGILGFVRANNGEQVVLLEEGACGGIREEVRAPSDVVVDEEIVRLLLSKFFERVSPEDVAHQAVRRWLAKTIDLHQSAVSRDHVMLTYALQVIEGMELRAQTTVYAEELLVHDGSQRQCAERVHACFVNGLGVLVLALELEGEVISQMPALVVPAEEPERVRVPDLQRPQIQDALRKLACAQLRAATIHTSMLK
jgi:hypothetical protein